MAYHSTYSNKAKIYAKYRWNYAPEALQTILSRTGLPAEAVVADIGAGTGILTRQLTQHFLHILAIEPNAAMRQEARNNLNEFTNCLVLAAAAEETALASHSVDLISIAQAVHWFDARPARAEFIRILNPGGWLTILRNQNIPGEISSALQKVFIPELGVRPAHAAPSLDIPASFYYCGRLVETWRFPFTIRQDWEAFLGAICSASNMPDEMNPLFPRFENAVYEIFRWYNKDGIITTYGETELVLGQPGGYTV